MLRARMAGVMRATLRPASWPIAVKMTLAMMATALLPMMITAYYNLEKTQEHVAAVELRNLEQLAQSTAGRIAQLLGDSRNLADYVGTDDDFVAYLQKPTTGGTQEILRKLQGLVKANPDIQFTMVMNTNGDAVVATDPNVMGKNFKFREYFKTAMEGRPFMTGIIVGAVAGAAGVFYSRPVLDPQGKVIGAVVMRIKADPIGRILANTKVGNERLPFLIDEDDPGRLLENAEEESAMEALLRENLSPVEQQAIWLRCFERLPVEEVTRILGLTNTSGARSVLQSAREKLRRAIERRAGGERRA